jgi:hypothetical protein
MWNEQSNQGFGEFIAKLADDVVENRTFETEKDADFSVFVKKAPTNPRCKSSKPEHIELASCEKLCY